MRERRKHRERRKAKGPFLGSGVDRRKGDRRANAAGTAALTAALAFGAVGPAKADIYTRRNASGTIEATNVAGGADFRLTYRGRPTTLVRSPTGRLRLSYNSDFDHHISAAAGVHGVSIELVRAIIQVESGFDARATSTKGAKGLMQLMPDTARDMGVSNVLDPRQNIFAGARYLRFLLDAFHGNVTLAAAAYNAGPTVVKRYQGVPPYKETQDYVSRVQSLLGLRPQAFPAPTPAPAPPQQAMFFVPNDTHAAPATVATRPAGSSRRSR